MDWRASLVPAAAVIPAPGAYTSVVAVKTLVVGDWRVEKRVAADGGHWPLWGWCLFPAWGFGP